jgi:hypothetical protein
MPHLEQKGSTHLKQARKLYEIYYQEHGPLVKIVAHEITYKS